MLATTGDDGAVRVWDPATGDELFEFQDENGATAVRSGWGPSFSPDGSRLAAAWPGDVVRVIDVATGEVVRRDRGCGDASSTAFSPDGRRIVIGSWWFEEPIATVVDATTGEELLTLRGDNDWAPAMSSGARTAGGSPPRGTTRRSASGTRDTGELRFTMTGHTATVYGLDWSPDATRLATASDDGTARISEITDGGIRELVSFSAQDTSHGAQRRGVLARRRTADDRRHGDHLGEDLGRERNRRRRVGERAERAVPVGGAIPHGRLHARQPRPGREWR